MRDFLLTILLITSLLLPAIGLAQEGNHVVLISVDGFRPEFYLDESYTTLDIPNLKKLKEQGTYARVAESVFPSMSYPAHTSMVTGVPPGKHGVLANTKFMPGSKYVEAYWYASDIEVKTIWDAAEEKDLRTAIFGWPATVGAKVDHLIPEIWASRSGITTLELIRKHSRGPVLEIMEKRDATLTGKLMKSAREKDWFFTECACESIIAFKPHLLLVHFSELDKMQHRYGRDSEEVGLALVRIDVLIGRIVEALEDAGIVQTSTIIVVGDHGMMDVHTRIALNRLFIEAGFIRFEDDKLVEWEAMVHSSGATAYVYLKEESDVEVGTRVREVLESNAVREGKTLYRIIPEEEANSFGMAERAFLYLEAAPGYTMSNSLRKPLLTESPYRANHGYVPTRPEMHTGFIIWGKRIRKGAVVDKVSIMDIAPTIARILDFEMPDVSGRVLEEVLETE